MSQVVADIVRHKVVPAIRADEGQREHCRVVIGEELTNDVSYSVMLGAGDCWIRYHLYEMRTDFSPGYEGERVERAVRVALGVAETEHLNFRAIAVIIFRELGLR